MQLEVWSDVVCPWCYVGKRKLELALERWDGEPVDVVWRPFQLDPRAENSGRPMVEVLAGKFGADGARQAQARVTEVAASVGLDYDLARQVEANTFEAHELLLHAREQGVQGAVGERFFRAHFTEGADLGDRATLVGLAEEAGLAGAADALADADLADRLERELAEGLAIGVRSVPTFVVGNRGVAGAQDPEVLLDLLRTGG
ncbi:DsbA family oxidoreductase [Saccharothrix syringae]|uniref:DsbA family oxidoreductase n=1 Tax=Saccharothrix syringae TaxID=103733 RepID=UPI0005255FDD|nr:DsbA family oxidoreductase [Saccharothrix syringae]